MDFSLIARTLIGVAVEVVVGFLGRSIIQFFTAQSASADQVQPRTTKIAFYTMLLFSAYELALLWCVPDIEHKSRLVYFLAATPFVP